MARKPTPSKSRRRPVGRARVTRDTNLLAGYIEQLLREQEQYLVRSASNQVYTYESPFYGCSGTVEASSYEEAMQKFRAKEENSHCIERSGPYRGRNSF